MSTAPDSPDSDTQTDVETSSVDPFAAVPEALVEALRRRGFTQLSKVQEAVLAADFATRDLRITSQTGSGKTVALGFALAARIEEPAKRGPNTLVIAPTRELAAQVKEELAWLFADLRHAHCEVVTGGTSVVKEQQQLRRNKPTVVVGTPGRLLDHVRSGALDLGGVRQLVLDEADQMLDLGFKDELDALVAELPPERRTHLVSATFPINVRTLADRCQHNPLLIAGTAAGQAHGDIEHIALKVGARDHYAVLVNMLLLAGEERTLVFVRTREDTTALADKLAADGFLALPINGDLAQSHRTRTLQAFRRGSIHTLIATDVAARGLDIADVTTVVHMDLPLEASTYVHRSGRTGRAGQKGRSVVLVVKSRESRTRRLLHQAKVEPVWQCPPTAAEVRAHQLAHAADLARAAMADPEGSAHRDGAQAIASELLRDRDPETVVAVLLAQTANGVRAPFEVTTPPGAAAPFATPQEATPPKAAPPAAPAAPAAPRTKAPHTPAGKARLAASEAPIEPPAPQAPPKRLSADQRGRPGAPPSWQRGGDPAAESEPGFVRFRINWGSRDGAETRRVLAHVCRRSGIPSNLIGAITVHVANTTFEVAESAVATFAKRVRAPDRRDPHLVIVADRPRATRAHAKHAEEGAAEE